MLFGKKPDMLYVLMFDMRADMMSGVIFDMVFGTMCDRILDILIAMARISPHMSLRNTKTVPQHHKQHQHAHQHPQ